MTSAPPAIASIVMRGRGPELLAAIRDRAVLLDLHDDPTARPEVREEPRLVLEPAPADDVQLRVLAHRPLDEAGDRGPLELGQVLAGEVGDEVGGGIDGTPVDAIHAVQP